MPTDVQLEPTPTTISPKEALDRMRHLLASMPASELIRAALDPSRAASLVIGNLPRIEKHRAALEAQFGEQATAPLDELCVIANATRQADIELAAADTAGDLPARFLEVAADHKLLLGDAEALANRKLLDRVRIDAGRPCQGYRATAKSALVLIALLRAEWPRIEDVTPLTPEVLDAIEVRAQTLVERLEEREQGSTELPALDMRSRALSRLIRTYGEVRRMLAYLRWWEGDAETIAPSLFSGRRKPRTPAATPVEQAPPSASPAEPALPPPADAVPSLASTPSGAAGRLDADDGRAAAALVESGAPDAMTSSSANALRAPAAHSPATPPVALARASRSSRRRFTRSRARRGVIQRGGERFRAHDP